MSPTKRNVFAALAAALVLLVLLRAGQKIISNRNALKNGQTPAIPVAVARVEKKTVLDTLELTGDIRGLNEARVFPKVPGRLLRKVKTEGEIVKKGEVLALVDRDEPALKFAAAEVTSPLGGVLTRYFLDLGQNVTPATPVCEVADVSPVKVVVKVTEKEFPHVRLGLEASFSCDAYPRETFRGRVTKMSDALDPATRSAEVEIEAQNPGQRLKPGMFARVELVLGSREGALVIPRGALIEMGESRYVFAVVDGKAERRDVQPGLKDETEAEIIRGVSEGERVITVGWQNVTGGTPVEVVENR